MEGRRQALLGTWTFLLALHVAVQTAKGDGAGQQSMDITTWLMHLSGETFYGQSTTRESTSSLLGKNAYCLKMTFLKTGTSDPPKTLSLFYIDASNQAESSRRANASLDIKPEPPRDVTFQFTHTGIPTLQGRAVKYTLLKAFNTDASTFCSILQTSKEKSNCAYWVLVMGGSGTVPDECQPDPIEKDCKVENYTLAKPWECGVVTSEEEGEDEEDDDDDDVDEEDDNTDWEDEEEDEEAEDEEE
ncbi:putative transmembrane protein [Ixodes scapularis]